MVLRTLPASKQWPCSMRVCAHAAHEPVQVAHAGDTSAWYVRLRLYTTLGAYSQQTSPEAAELWG